MTDNARIVREDGFFDQLKRVSTEAQAEVEKWPPLERESVKRFENFGSIRDGEESVDPCFYAPQATPDWEATAKEQSQTIQALLAELATAKADLERARVALREIGEEARRVLIETPKGENPMMMAPWVAGTAYTALGAKE